MFAGGNQWSESGFTGLSDFRDCGHTRHHLLNLDNLQIRQTLALTMAFPKPSSHPSPPLSKLLFMPINSDPSNINRHPPITEAGAETDLIPGHVAIIMDGNGRWAERQGLPRKAGHRRGVSNIRRIVDLLAQRGVRVVTLYAFSTENWRRPSDEVDSLMAILAEEIEPQTRELHRAGVKLVHLGDMTPLDPALQESIQRAQDFTRQNVGVTVNVAFNYGGRDEILQAVRRMIEDGVVPDAVDESLFSQYLYTDGCPDPDLIIRTGGEQRLSNFLIWQAAYSEYYHTPVLWPDLGAEDLDRALIAYSQRQRRFGSLDIQDDPVGA